MEDALWKKVCDKGAVSIRDWYHKAFPTDEIWKEMDPQPEFVDAALFIYAGVDIYFLLGVSDSVVRERVFEHLSEIMEVPYDTIYNRWLEA
ncbi:hypothetical protein [Selenomonas ruminantium]|uniref:hypothetical protein n=1 Tax=Selenomonas ruminantium TaxID=971 RepID=UPI0026F320E0|nr:hypothetical protein [Selenomonas ruminantium]